MRLYSRNSKHVFKHFPQHANSQRQRDNTREAWRDIERHEKSYDHTPCDVHHNVEPPVRPVPVVLERIILRHRHGERESSNNQKWYESHSMQNPVTKDAGRGLTWGRLNDYPSTCSGGCPQHNDI
jgi:hypothetical protein